MAEIGGEDSAAELAENIEKEELRRQRTVELETERQRELKLSTSNEDRNHEVSSGSCVGDIGKTKITPRVAAVHGLNRPFFHIDLVGALHSAIANIETRKLFEDKGGPGIGQLP